MSTLTKIQCELKAPKNRHNSFGDYNYRSCEDILEAVKPLLNKYDATLTLFDDVVNIGERYYIKATASLIVDGIGYTVTALAREAPEKKKMDDSQVTGTASSYARKYALNGLFLIDDTKDADTDEYAKQVTERKEQRIGEVKGIALQTVLESSGQDVSKFLAYYKVKSLADLTEEQHRAIYEGLRKRGGNGKNS